MNKAELVAAMAKAAGLSKVDAEKALKATVLADQKKCQFVVNGKEKGEFNL